MDQAWSAGRHGPLGSATQPPEQGARKGRLYISTYHIKIDSPLAM